MRFAIKTTLFVLCACSIVAVGCSSDNQGTPCVNISESPPRLVEPASGATSVPASIGDLIVTGIGDPGTFTLEAVAGFPVPIGSPEPVPSAQASSLPSFNPVTAYKAIPVPTLSPATQYTLTYKVTPTGGPCGPIQQSGTVGFFTTQ